jgi:hypothetical protein
VAVACQPRKYNDSETKNIVDTSPVDDRSYLDQLMWVEDDFVYMGFCEPKKFEKKDCQFGVERTPVKKFESIFLNETSTRTDSKVREYENAIDALRKLSPGDWLYDRAQGAIRQYQQMLIQARKEAGAMLEDRKEAARNVLESLKSNKTFQIAFSLNSSVKAIHPFEISFSTLETSFIKSLAGQAPLNGDNTLLDVYLWRTRKPISFAQDVTAKSETLHTVTLFNGRFQDPREQLNVGDKICDFRFVELPVVKGELTVFSSEKMRPSGGAYLHPNQPTFFGLNIRPLDGRGETKFVYFVCGKYLKTELGFNHRFQQQNDLTIGDLKSITGGRLNFGSGGITY